MKYLINRTDALGDNILTMPMAQAIKELDKEAEVAFITSPLCAPLYIDHPYVDKIFILSKSESYYSKLTKSFKILREFKPDFYFFIGGSQTPNFAALVSRIKFRAGILSRWTTFLTLNKGTRQKRSQVAQHEIFYNVDLLRHLDGFEHVDDKEYYPIFSKNSFDKSERIVLQDFSSVLTDNGLDARKPLIFVHPGMTGHTLNWPSEKYAKLIARLNSKYPNTYNFIVSHTPSDEHFLTNFRVELDKHVELKSCVYFFNGAVKGLENYMNTLKHAKAFVGPSTGTLHIAATLEVPVVGIFSPIKAQSVLRWGPQGTKNVMTVTPDVVCGEVTKCSREVCPYYECMSKIEVDEIINNLKPMLESDV